MRRSAPFRSERGDPGAARRKVGFGPGVSSKLVLAELQRRSLLSEPARLDLENALSELRIIEDRIVKKQRCWITLAAAGLESLRKKVDGACKLEIEERSGAR